MYTLRQPVPVPPRCSKMSGPVRVNLYNSPWIRLALTKAVWVTWRIAIPLLLWKVRYRLVSLTCRGRCIA